MNQNHQRILLVTFQHVDRLISEAERIMNSEYLESPFQEYTQDSTPTQRQVMHEEILKLREKMLRIVNDLKISAAQPTTGVLWAAHNHLAFASLVLVEIQARHIKGYGDLSDEEQKLFDNISEQLREPIDHLGKYLLNGERPESETKSSGR